MINFNIRENTNLLRVLSSVGNTEKPMRRSTLMGEALRLRKNVATSAGQVRPPARHPILDRVFSKVVGRNSTGN